MFILSGGAETHTNQSFRNLRISFIASVYIFSFLTFSKSITVKSFSSAAHSVARDVIFIAGSGNERGS